METLFDSGLANDGTEETEEAAEEEEEEETPAAVAAVAVVAARGEREAKSTTEPVCACVHVCVGWVGRWV